MSTIKDVAKLAGVSVAYELLEKHPNIDGIVAGNDLMEFL